MKYSALFGSCHNKVVLRPVTRSAGPDLALLKPTGKQLCHQQLSLCELQAVTMPMLPTSSLCNPNRTAISTRPQAACMKAQHYYYYYYYVPYQLAAMGTQYDVKTDLEDNSF